MYCLNNSRVTMLLTAAIMLLGGLIAGCNTKGDQIIIEKPVPPVPVIPPLEAKEFGLPAYPGATIVDDGGRARSIVKDTGLKMAQFKTTDPLEKVMNFYKIAFPHSLANTPLMARHCEWSKKLEAGVPVVTCMISNPNAGTAMKMIRISTEKSNTIITMTRIEADKTKEEIFAKPPAPSQPVEVKPSSDKFIMPDFKMYKQQQPSDKSSPDPGQ